MKIRNVIQNSSTYPQSLNEGMGGILRVPLELAEFFSRWGNDVELICYNPSALPQREKVDVGELIRIRKWDFLKWGERDYSYHFPLFLWCFKNRGCDILHVHGDPYLLHLPKAKGRILHLHTEIWRRPVTSCLRALNRADAIICCSNYVKNTLLNYSDYPKEKIYVIYNGVNLEDFSRTLKRDEIRHKLGIDDNAVVLLYAGQLQEEKGLVFLIKAFRELSRHFDDLNLLIAGSGKLWLSSTTGEEFEARFRRLSRSLKVHFLGKVPRKEMASVYSASDAFVLPSLAEGFPLTIMEAMAAGKPVVATRVGGIPEVVKDGENGYLVQPKEVKGLIDAISNLMEDEALRAKMGREGRKTVKDYTWEKSASEINRIYERLR